MDSHDFYLTPRGLIDRLQIRLGLLRSDAPRLRRRALLGALLAWAPLCVMSLVRPAPDGVAVTFFHDIAAYVRFLVVIPLLIMVERSIGLRTKLVVSDFASSGLVADWDAPRLQTAFRRARSLLDSTWIDLVLIAAAYGIIALSLREILHDGTQLWFEMSTPTGERLTPAGYWYAFVASPMGAFLFMRWFWRYLVWSWLLYRISKMDLRLAPSHPDRVGGLAIVNVGHTSFAAIAFASSCVLAAAGANRILYEGVALKTYQPAIIGFIAISVAVGLLPLLSFSRPLIISKWMGLSRYGKFSSRYVYGFERKWLQEGVEPSEPLLGSADIQSLADLEGGFNRVDTMRAVPCDRRTVMAFALASAVPMLPLLLTVMPLREMVAFLFKAML